MALEAADREVIKQIVDDALAGAGEQFAAQAASAAQAKLDAWKPEPPAAPAIDKDALSATVSEQVAAALAEQAAKREADAAAASAAAAISAKRDEILNAKATKLPKAYRDRIPMTDDAAALDAAITEQFAACNADLTASGVTPIDFGTGAAAAAGDAVTVTIADLDKDPAKKGEYIKANGIAAYLKLANPPKQK